MKYKVGDYVLSRYTGDLAGLYLSKITDTNWPYSHYFLNNILGWKNWEYKETVDFVDNNSILIKEEDLLICELLYF